jgi:hypothetical protein
MRRLDAPLAETKRFKRKTRLLPRKRAWSYPRVALLSTGIAEHDAAIGPFSKG